MSKGCNDSNNSNNLQLGFTDHGQVEHIDSKNISDLYIARLD
jgi:hypothetical protein